MNKSQKSNEFPYKTVQEWQLAHLPETGFRMDSDALDMAHQQSEDQLTVTFQIGGCFGR